MNDIPINDFMEKYIHIEKKRFDKIISIMEEGIAAPIQISKLHLQVEKALRLLKGAE